MSLNAHARHSVAGVSVFSALMSVCVPMCVSKHIHCNSHTQIQLNVVTHYIHSYGPTLKSLLFYRCLLNYRADTPSGNKINFTLFIVISCIGKDTIH